MITKLYADLCKQTAEGKKLLALLLDPDKTDAEACRRLLGLCAASPPDWLLLGGSLVMNHRLAELVAAVREAGGPPVVLFPGNPLHICPQADALLLLSLISGRNPEFLIGHHVVAAPLLRQSGLEIMPTGYMLVDGGRPTTASYMSNTTPLPYDKPDVAAATAMAGELLGLKLLYLDGGSGALHPVPPATIAAVRASVALPLLVGGGLRTPESLQAAYQAGADVAVIGTAIEQSPALWPALAQVRDGWR